LLLWYSKMPFKTIVCFNPIIYKIMKFKFFPMLFSIFILFIAMESNAQNEIPVESKDHLVVIWSSDDPYVAEKVTFMYTHAAKKAGWFSEVTLIIWGPSAKLTSENIKIQEKLQEMQKDGVKIEACIACARSYSVDDDLEKLGFDVKGMGTYLTDYLKSGAKVLTF
ncbi:MAG: DsrE family protein, partial [Bacteroidales bacterium]